MLKIYPKYGKAYLKAPWNTFNTYAKYFTHFIRLSSTLKILIFHVIYLVDCAIK